ncbi:MAG TPA: Ppx/GppA family phosphatase, partial [Halanaerobiales bacterium]|nr:Ppx/GppA family phosphatase [Halanaerobiales bacterium]
MKLGVIDVGTNSCRLLIMENTDRGWREIKKDLIITRLGEGVDKNGQLNEKAMLRTFKAIYRFLAEMDEAGVKKKTIIGTSALRDVSNADILLELLRTKTGLGIDIIDGEKETYLNYLGA